MSSGRYAEQTSTPSERKPDVTKAKAGSYSICFHYRQRFIIKDFLKVTRFLLQYLSRYSLCVGTLASMSTG